VIEIAFGMYGVLGEAAALSDEHREESDTDLSPESTAERKKVEVEALEAQFPVPTNKYYAPACTRKYEGPLLSSVYSPEMDPWTPFMMLRNMRAAHAAPKLKDMQEFTKFALFGMKYRNRWKTVLRRNPVRECRIIAFNKAKAADTRKFIETPPNLFFFRGPTKKIGKEAPSKRSMTMNRVEKYFDGLKKRVGWTMDDSAERDEGRMS